MTGCYGLNAAALQLTRPQIDFLAARIFPMADRKTSAVRLENRKGVIEAARSQKDCPVIQVGIGAAANPGKVFAGEPLLG